jgi:hypothetical protein
MSGAETERAPRAVTAGILVVSVAVLMAQVLLTRIFSFTIWYHLAYLTLSTALLGFGAAGAILAAFPSILERDVRSRLGVCAGAAGIALLVAMAVLGPNPLEPDRLLETPVSFFFGLLGYYLAVVVPFLLAGMAVAGPLTRWASQVDRLYAADLLGAGLGCLAAVAALYWLDGAAALFVCAGFFTLGGALYAGVSRQGRVLGCLTVALFIAAPWGGAVLDFQPTASKQLAVGLARPGARVLHSQWSPVNRVDLYGVPGARGGMWGGFGLNPAYKGPIPRVLDIQYDGHNGSNVFQVKTLRSLRMLEQHILRTPYLLLEDPRVLVIGVGGGIDILNALYQGASRVTGAELQPITVKLHNTVLSEWTGGQFQRPEVELVAAEGRHFVRSRDQAYDLIQVTAVDTFSAQSTGAYLLAESYLYTVEAFEEYLEHLEDDGVFSIVLGDWLYADEALPSPLAARLALVARAALERRGVKDPRAHMMMVAQRYESGAEGPVSGSMIGDLLVKKAPFTSEEIGKVRTFAEANGFELRLTPDAPGDPSIARIVNAKPEDLAGALASQPFAIEPVTDARPFFYHVLRWSSLWSEERIQWIFPGSTTGQIVLLMMLGQALLLGGALILLPLWRGAREGLSGTHTLAFLVYFLGLGVGFMLIEISFIQKYVLLLGYPTYSLSVTLAALLISTALGASLSRRGWQRPRPFLLSLLAVTVLLVGIEAIWVPAVRDAFLSSSLATRIALTAVLQLPIGLCLGMYFPTGIEILRQHQPRLVPWAWALNGVGSVTSSVLAVVLAMAIGFSGVAIVALGVYVVGVLSLVAVLPRSGSQGG